MDILCFGQQNWDYCWTEKQQLMMRLARRGHRILYIDPDGDRVAFSEYGWKHWLPGRSPYQLRQFAPNLYLLRFFYLNRLERRLKLSTWGDCMASVLQQLAFQDAIALVMRPWPMRILLQRVRYRALIYYAVDEWTAFGGLSKATRALFRREEEFFLRQSSLALAISPRLLRRFKTLQPRSYLLENAADINHFAPEKLANSPGYSRVKSLPKPHLGFIGQIDERLDSALLTSVMKARPHWQLILVGRLKSGVDFSALTALPNVHYLGFQPYSTLTNILREIDVCLVPYRLTELTHSCWPLKVMEYLATGKPIVATPLESLLPLEGIVALAATPQQFLQAIETALSDPSQGREERLAVAANNSWESRSNRLEEHLLEAAALAEERNE